MRIEKIIAVVFFLFASGAVFSQEEEEAEELIYYNFPTTIPEKLSPIIEGDFKMPTPLENKAFDEIANGIADINLLFQYPVFRFFSIGGGFKYQYFQFRDFISNNSFSNSGKLFNYAPFLRLSYIRFSSPRLFWQFSSKAGYSYQQFECFSCENAGLPQQKQESTYIEPQIGAHLFVDESLSFSLVVSDIIMFNTFKPSLMCLSNFAGFNIEDSQKYYNVFSIGFGFTYFFNKKGMR